MPVKLLLQFVVIYKQPNTTVEKYILVRVLNKGK